MGPGRVEVVDEVVLAVLFDGAGLGAFDGCAAPFCFSMALPAGEEAQLLAESLAGASLGLMICYFCMDSSDSGFLQGQGLFACHDSHFMEILRF